MLTLQLVNHCWNYWRLATLHLSQLCLHPPQRCRVICTICHAPAGDDPNTAAVLAYFSMLQIENVKWDFFEMPARDLCRRAIGRNIVCQSSKADFVLLGDIDYCFGAGAMDAAAEQLEGTLDSRGPAIMFPREIKQSIDHACGDAEIARVDRPRILDLSGELYQTTELRTAIGGAQYIPGDFARKEGYLPRSRRFQRPAEVWVRTFCDRAFRRWSGLPVVAIDVPQVYRVRHSTRGRFDIGVEL